MNVSPMDFEYIRGIVRTRAAIVIEPGKEYLVEARLAPLAGREGFESLSELVGRMRAGNSEPLHKKVVDALTTNETSFFRDVDPFDALRSSVLPALIESRSAERRLNIWCAACSTGQEPYTIAMILREHFPNLAPWRVSILATDLSSNVLERARAGAFSQLEVNRGLPAMYLVKYFDRKGAEFVVKPTLKSLIEFREMNLVSTWPVMPLFDIVMIRNVLIYFDVETKRSLLQKVKRALCPDGSLFLGAAETTMNLDDGFERVRFERGSCYRIKK